MILSGDMSAIKSIIALGSLPFVFVTGLFQGRTRGVVAKGRGIVEGLAGGKVTPASLDRYKKE